LGAVPKRRDAAVHRQIVLAETVRTPERSTYAECLKTKTINNVKNDNLKPLAYSREHAKIGLARCEAYGSGPILAHMISKHLQALPVLA
jgi:hypothetical protein